MTIGITVLLIGLLFIIVRDPDNKHNALYILWGIFMIALGGANIYRAKISDEEFQPKTIVVIEALEENVEIIYINPNSKEEQWKTL